MVNSPELPDLCILAPYFSMFRSDLLEIEIYYIKKHLFLELYIYFWIISGAGPLVSFRFLDLNFWIPWVLFRFSDSIQI